MADFIGTPGGDTFTGTSGNDGFRLETGGDDLASGAEGNDGFYFGSALTSADMVDGGLGIDTIALQGNYLALTLGAINNVEVLLAMAGDDTRFGDTANNFYDYAIATIDANLSAGQILTLIGGNLRAGEDLSFDGSAEGDGNFRIFAGQGSDTLRGGSGNDGFFFGQDGNLTGADRIDGGAGTDSVALRGNYVGGRAVQFEAASLANVEVVTLLSGHSNEFGGFVDANGFDYDLTMADGNVAANQRLDIIAGNLRSNESLRFDGRAETDGSYRIIAGAGDDVIYGSANTYTIAGGLGNDTLIGGEVGDIFVFNTALGPDNIDRIVDFSHSGDTIQLAGAPGQPFSALATGQLNWTAFTIGAAAQDADDRIIYDPASGALFYDPDGTGSVAATQFAILPPNLDKVGPNLNINADDFQVTGPNNIFPVIHSGASASIAENSPTSTIVYQIVASDADGDGLAYAVEGSDKNKFTVDANGAVRLIASADFETQSIYDIVVYAWDSSGFGDQQHVIVSVANLDESAGATPVIAEAESNDTIGTAQTVGRGALAVAVNPELFDDAVPAARIEGAISAGADVDYYSISLQWGELLILDVDNLGTSLDSVIRIYDASGKELFVRDDGWRDPGSAQHPQSPLETADGFLWFETPYTATYYFSVESWGPDSETGPGSGTTSGAYRLNLSLEARAGTARILELESLALLSGYAQADIQVSYSFPTSASHYPGYPDEYAEDLTDLQPFSAAQQAAINTQLQLIGNVSGLQFQPLTPGPADLRYAMNGTNLAAYALYPDGSAEAGSAWFNKQDFNDPVAGNYSWLGMLHETGHALGLKHGHEFPEITERRDTLEYTIMTYRSFFGHDIDDWDTYLNEEWGYPQTLMILDIAALQKMYGANFSFNASDSVYQWSPTTGEMSINGVGQGAPGANRVFMTVWDGGGVDTYDLSNFTGVTIDLRPGGWSQTSWVQRAFLGSPHAAGNVANALQFEGDPRSLIENAIGGSAADTIIANHAANVLTGGAGNDIFRWVSAADAGTGASADRITDYVRGSDRIDLSQIDAIAGPPYDNWFTFINAEAFHGQAGELRYQIEGANLRLQADIDGDGVADMEIVFDNLALLSPGDFIF